MRLAPISTRKAKAVFKRHSAFRGDFDLAVAVEDEAGQVHGVIALRANGEEFSMAHLYTDANAQVGSLLYGASCRIAKALGYRWIWI